jgi:DNA primase
MFKANPRPGIVIPFTHNNQLVGSCVRFLDDRTPKYLNDMQSGYVFGTDLQRDSWQSVLVMEGVFDALSIGGLAVLHAEVNDAQVRLIRSLGREVIVVPDQDAAGMKLVDRAVELGWSVSMPNWGDDVKDVNDAVIKYGRLGALLIIMQSRETSRIKIELRKKQIVKRVNTQKN